MTSPQEASPRPAASPETGYYGLPVLKKPVWTWEVPMYLFVGGIAGPASIIAAVAERRRRRPGSMESSDAAPAAGDGLPTLVRDARWIAAAGGLASAALLIADLGRPERFFNMLRVFKPQSPMSVGSWILMAFSSTAAAAAVADAIAARTDGRLPVTLVHGLQESAPGFATAGALTGSLLSTYTGVLIGATAIPVWNANARLLPLHFGAAGLGSAASLLELLGHDDSALHDLALLAAAIETGIFVNLERHADPKLKPLKAGATGTSTRLGGLMAGPLPLLLRLLAGRSRRLRQVAALSSLAGSLLSRFAWIHAGRASARDPRVPLELPQAPRAGLLQTASQGQSASASTHAPERSAHHGS